MNTWNEGIRDWWARYPLIVSESGEVKFLRNKEILVLEEAYHPDCLLHPELLCVGIPPATYQAEIISAFYSHPDGSPKDMRVDEPDEYECWLYPEWSEFFDIEQTNVEVKT